MDATDLTPLVERCRAGDALAWEAFVRQLQGRLFALAYSYAGDREDARDLAQEIFVRLYEARSHWPSGDEFLPWLFRVARNRSVDYLRRRSVRRPAVAVDEAEIGELARLRARRRSAGDRGGPPQPAPRRPQGALGDQPGNRRPPRRARAGIQQVASILGIPLGTVKSRASRARVELAERVLALSRGQGET